MGRPERSQGASSRRYTYNSPEQCSGEVVVTTLVRLVRAHALLVSAGPLQSACSARAGPVPLSLVFASRASKSPKSSRSRPFSSAYQSGTRLLCHAGAKGVTSGRKDGRRRVMTARTNHQVGRVESWAAARPEAPSAAQLEEGQRGVRGDRGLRKLEAVLRRRRAGFVAHLPSSARPHILGRWQRAYMDTWT